MRVKTEAKRDAIVEMASQVFLESGYERASMAQIAERVGGSKGTLYSYFPSKEALFVEVVLQASRREFGPIMSDLEHGSADLNVSLRRFGEAFVAVICRPDSVGGRRAVLAEAGQSDIGLRFYEAGPKIGERHVGEFLEAEMRAGRLRQADPRLAALQLFALLEAESSQRFMLGVLTKISKAEIKRVVDRAITTFMAAYSG